MNDCTFACNIVIASIFFHKGITVHNSIENTIRLYVTSIQYATITLRFSSFMHSLKMKMITNNANC